MTHVGRCPRSRIPGLFALALGWCLLSSTGAVGAASHPDPDSLDLSIDLSTMDMEELRVLRHAVYVRHCQPLPFGQMASEYRDYLQRHCGRNYSWEAGRSEAVSETPFTEEEERFVARVLERESDIRSTQIENTLAGPRYRSDAIVNRSQFALPDSVLDSLLQRGFVTVPSRDEQLFHVYEQNDYAMIPSFITSDVVFHLVHVYFGRLLRDLERRDLSPATAEFASRMGQRLQSFAARPPSDSATGEIHRFPAYFVEVTQVAAYFAVAEQLALGDSTGVPPSWLAPLFAHEFRRQRALVESRASTERGPFGGTFDAGLLRPRGHYTANAELKHYFKAMSWLSHPPLPLDEGHREASLRVAWEVSNDSTLSRLYDRVDDTLAFLIGPSDDIGPRLLAVIANEIAGPDFDAWCERADSIVVEAGRRNPEKIGYRSVTELRVFPRRYIPDGEILAAWGKEGPRGYLPGGLDLFSVLDAPVARRFALEAQPFAEYEQSLQRITTRFHELQDGTSNETFYSRWMNALRRLHEPDVCEAAPFLAFDPWAAKSLETSLASWAELRHDTILYSKQFGAECGGGDEAPLVPGFVEPEPEVYHALAEMVRDAQARFGHPSSGPLRISADAQRLEEMLTTFENVSRSELRGEALGKEVYDWIRGLGGEIEWITASFLLDDGGTWYNVQGTDRSIAIVADVQRSGNRVREVAVGNADHLYALVVLDGDLYLTRGATLSYYEFEGAADRRMTNEEWQETIRKGDAPRRPWWISSFWMNSPSLPLPHRYGWSSGC